MPHTPESRLCRTDRPLTPLIPAVKPKPGHRQCSNNHPKQIPTNLSTHSQHTIVPRNLEPLSMTHLLINLLLLLLSAYRTLQVPRARLLATSNSSSSNNHTKIILPQFIPPTKHPKFRLPLPCPRSRTNSSSSKSNSPHTPTPRGATSPLPPTNLHRYPGQRSNHSTHPTTPHPQLKAPVSIKPTSLRARQARTRLHFIGN